MVTPYAISLSKPPHHDDSNKDVGEEHFLPGAGSCVRETPGAIKMVTPPSLLCWNGPLVLAGERVSLR
jgi:hypothetical protein